MMVQNNPQAKILLYLMPFMILVIGIFLPAAVILYWVVGNIFMIAQTYFITGPNTGKRGLESTVGVNQSTTKYVFIKRKK